MAKAYLSRRTLLGAGTSLAAGLSMGALSDRASAAEPGLEPFGPVTLYQPPADRPAPGTLYGRAVRLAAAPGVLQGDRPRTLLATFEQYVDTMPVFPIFRSDDDGRTWIQQSSVQDTQNGWGMRYQPFLYQLPLPFAGLPMGALLCAGNSIPDDLSQTKIDLYASTDGGLSWRFLSSIARGGRAIPNNGETPVWEPFLLLHHDRMICFYSDQRDPNYGQKLVHQTSRDLKHWNPPVDDAVGTDYPQRPGMTTVAALPLGRWIMTYEGGGGAGNNFFAIHYKIAPDPLSFGPVTPQILHDQSGYVPSSSPTVSWSPWGGGRGTIVVSANSDDDFFVNRALGDPGSWTRSPSLVPRGYTRFNIPLENGLVFTVNGGHIGNPGLNSVIDGISRLS
ncbi:MAG: hypothetical protein J2P23_13495 [Microlunatus sp.]|nr:hypothetical protein [Microlunatus sp.]